MYDCCFDDDNENDNVDDSKSIMFGLVCDKIEYVVIWSLIGWVWNWIWVLLEGEVDFGFRVFFGMVIIYIVGFFIIFSIFIIVYEIVFCENVEKVCKERIWILDLLDNICVGVFSVEFCFRFFVCLNIVEFVKNLMNIIDFLLILFFYLMLLLEFVVGLNLEVFVVFWVLRIFRVFKLIRYFKCL